MASSPFRSGSSVEDQLAYYKTQYEQLELELQDFQASSRDLEAELEKDVEASEKRERTLKEQVENLQFEVDEWKTKHKQSKTEANSAQNALQKEITTMRDTNRTLNLKLRDIEVANDDYERQARNTTSSLDDLESKLNVSIERGVMLEEEIRSGEQEREGLRVETQRLRDELSDLGIESEISTEKLRLAESTIEQQRVSARARPLPLSARPALPRSPTSEASLTTGPSTAVSTPPTKSNVSDTSGVPTPPSPPLSDASAQPKILAKTSGMASRRSLLPDSNMTPRPGTYPARVSQHSRGPSITSATSSMAGTSTRMGPPPPRQSLQPAEPLARSGSLYQIKGLIGRMQKIEERVHSVRSKLPPPGKASPLRASPRPMPELDLDSHNLSPSVTVRSAKKRPSMAPPPPPFRQDDDASTDKLTGSHVKRLSFGAAPINLPERPTTSMSQSRPSSRAGNYSSHTAASQNGMASYARPSSRASSRASDLASHSAANAYSRPTSRASNYASHTAASHSAANASARPNSRAGDYASHSAANASARPSSRVGDHTSHSAANPYTRPSSRASIGGTRAPMGAQPPSTGSAAADRRPRSSMGGNYATMPTPRHRPSTSVQDIQEMDDSSIPTSSARRTTLDRAGVPTHSALMKKQSVGVAASGSSTRRPSLGYGQLHTHPAMPPPSDRRKKLSGVGETF